MPTEGIQPLIGIADLISGRIVTPLPPRETFFDDPLRVLRAICFVIEKACLGMRRRYNASGVRGESSLEEASD
ncbi:hypothetical protein RHMOL_Rhmol12G0128600 [Rhododendron molle]|uniref:Uncharacterized protein n=1 Tax=Rhododendron molle TaxID=49168 RepID=A0ACC0LHB6_RHOML|nr:hypothetical protein RHMOL_Rhmol12G0128600 [Rhododendron molle]